VPAITQSRDFAIAGGMMSYGGNFTLSHRLSGVYVGRVLKGEKPADLPVQQVTMVELFVNAKAASAVGLAMPNSLMGRADVVIE
jgi:putative ABC transport system substrate-binding protein